VCLFLKRYAGGDRGGVGCTDTIPRYAQAERLPTQPNTLETQC